jgi:hypothetical protein
MVVFKRAFLSPILKPLLAAVKRVSFSSAALPTATDQCKDNGWKTFGVFKNQGDCVSFVATGGKNPPAK